MKTIGLVSLCALLLCFGCRATKPLKGNPDLEFGSKFVAALAAQKSDAMLPLLIDEESARLSMTKAGEPEAEIEKQLAAFSAQLPKMKENLLRAYDYFQKELSEKGLAKAEFIQTTYQSESTSDKVEKRDLYVMFKLGTVKYIADVDDCVKTVNGWKMTGKFNIHPADK